MARIGGITPWLKVAHAAEAFNVADGVPGGQVVHVRLQARL